MENKYKKKILFIGMPDMAIICLARLISDGFNIIGVVPPHPGEPTYDFMVQFAKKSGLNVLTYEKSINDPDFINKVKILNADLAVVCSYNKKFSPALLSSVKGGFVNVHPSLLPKYRGANPYSHVILNDEKETGVTLHFMDENFDTGNIIWQKKVPVAPNDTMGTIFNKLNFVSAEMLSDFLKQAEHTPFIKSVPQPIGEYEKAFVIDNKNMKNYIDWSKDAAYIERFVRALNPFITAMTTFRGIFMKIYSAQVINKKVKEEPGTIISAKDNIAVATGDGVLCIKSLQFGSYMITDSKAFIQMFSPKQGEKLI